MRDPSRIYKFCHELASIWYEKAPDWRFGQFMSNVLNGIDVDPFFPEDEEMLALIRAYFG